MSAVRAGWWVVPLALIASLGSVAYLTAGEEPPAYETSATFSVGPAASLPNDNQKLRALEILERRTMLVTLSRIPTSQIISRRAAERVGVSAGDLTAFRVRGSVLPSAHMIRISVDGPDPDRVERLAVEVADLSVREAQRSYPVFELRPLATVDPPSGPVESDDRRSYAVAGVLGLFFGIGAAYGIGVLRSVKLEELLHEGSGAARLRAEEG